MLDVAGGAGVLALWCVCYLVAGFQHKAVERRHACQARCTPTPRLSTLLLLLTPSPNAHPMPSHSAHPPPLPPSPCSFPCADKEGVVQHSTINNLAFGRSVDETLRTLQVRKKGEGSGRAGVLCCWVF